MMQYVPAVLVRFTSLLSIVLNIVAATGRRRWSQQGKVQAENLQSSAATMSKHNNPGCRSSESKE
jgi:hypothetical protein